MENNVYRMDLRKNAASGWSYLSVALVVLICFSCNWYDMEYAFNPATRSDVTYIFTEILWIGEFKNMILIAAAIPCACNFCSDWNHKFICPVVMRCGVKQYSHSKIVSCIISTFLTVFIGLLLFVFLMNLRLPLYKPGYSGIIYGEPYDSLLNGNFQILYFIALIFNFSAATSFWGIVGLWITSWIPNRFVAIAAPFISYYLLGEFGEYLPDFMNFRKLSESYDVIGQGAGISILYTAAFFGVLIALFGKLFAKNVERRIANDMF